MQIGQSYLALPTKCRRSDALPIQDQNISESVSFKFDPMLQWRIFNQNLNGNFSLHIHTQTYSTHTRGRTVKTTTTTQRRAHIRIFINELRWSALKPVCHSIYVRYTDIVYYTQVFDHNGKCFASTTTWCLIDKIFAHKIISKTIVATVCRRTNMTTNKTTAQIAASYYSKANNNDSDNNSRLYDPE